MAKEREEKSNNEVYTISAKQLFENRKNRNVIPLTLSFDIAFGGGVPQGCTILLAGKPKTGKTSISLQLASNAQKLYKSKIFYANIEGRLGNQVLSQAQGLDLENLEVIMGPPIFSKENKDKILGYKKMSSQEWWSRIGEIITNNPESIIIVDSIAALSDEAELTEGMGYQSRGLLQKLESQFVRQYGDMIVTSGIILIMLTQIQANTSGYGEAIQMKCGNAIKHLADGIIFIKNIEKWKEDGSSGKILGHDMVCRVECSPNGSPHIEMKIPLRYSKGIDQSLDIARSCVDWQIIKSAGSWYVLPFKDNLDNLEILEIPDDKENQKDFIKIQGEENLRNWICNHPKYMNILDKTIRNKVFLT